MKLQRLIIKNFRSFTDFAIDLCGRSVFFIGECAIGKTSLLTAIARGLGKDYHAFTKADFADLGEAIEIQIVLNELNGQEESVFCDRLNFKDKTLKVGVRVTWDSNEESPISEHGYPEKDWQKSSGEERDALPLQWLSADRDVPRMLQFGFRRNLIAKLVDGLPIEKQIQEAILGVKEASIQLGKSKVIQNLLRGCQGGLSRLLPDVSPQAFDVTVSASTDLEILRQLELAVSHHGNHIPLTQQSSGLVQLIGYAFLTHLLKEEKGTILLIDQPENSLHPQSQRAVVNSLNDLDCQTIITTHSSNVLDHVDPRTILRLHRSDKGVRYSQPTHLSDQEARKLARYTTTQTAEAFFGKIAILVEGLSDLFAVATLAQRTGPDLNSEGITIVDMEGAGGLETFLKLLGPSGFQLKLAGLCDIDKEGEWAQVLQHATLCAGTRRTDLGKAGFFVCDIDLEDELIRAFGISGVLKLVDEQGEKAAFATFCAQPNQKGKSQAEQLRGFFAKKGRKVRYAPLIVERVDLAKMPQPLQGVLSHVRTTG